MTCHEELAVGFASRKPLDCESGVSCKKPDFSFQGINIGHVILVVSLRSFLNFALPGDEAALSAWEAPSQRDG